MKKLLSTLALFILFKASATTYYYIGGNGSTVDFTTSSAWSTSLGGAPGTIFTISYDDDFIIDGSDVSNSAGAQPGSALTISLGASRQIGNITILNNVAVLLTSPNLGRTITLDENINVSEGSSFTNNIQVNMLGSIVNNGTITGSTTSGRYRFMDTDCIISGSGVYQFREFMIETGEKLTMQADITLIGNGVINGMFGTLDATTHIITAAPNVTATVNIVTYCKTSNPYGARGYANSTTGTGVTLVTQATSTIEFYAPSGTQYIWADDANQYYQSIIISGGGVKELTNPAASYIDIRKDLTILPGNTLNALKNIEVTGNLVNNGTFVANTSTVELDGTIANQTLTMNGSHLYNLTLNNTNVNTTCMVLGSDATVTNEVNFIDGGLALGNYNFTYGLNATTSSTTSPDKFFITNGTGELRKVIPAGGQSFTFPIGNNNNTDTYVPLTLNFTANSVQRTVGVRTVRSQHPLDDSPTSYTERYWHFSTTPSTGTYTYDAFLNFYQTEQVGVITDISISYIYPPNNVWSGVLTDVQFYSLESTGITETTGSLNNADVTGRITTTCGQILSLTEDACTGYPYNFNGNMLTESGVYTDTLQSSTGCDSIVILDIEFHSPGAYVVNSLNQMSTTEFYSSYQWLYNGVPIEGEDSQTLTATQLGFYSVVVTDEYGCIDTSNVVNIIQLGLDESITGFKIFPIPTSNTVNIQSDNTITGKYTYTISDITGHQIQNSVYTSNDVVTSLDLSNYKQGVYLLTIIDSKGLRKTIRLLKV